MKKNEAFFGLVSEPRPGHCSYGCLRWPTDRRYLWVECLQAFPPLGVGRERYSQSAEHFSNRQQKNQPCSYAKKMKSTSNLCRPSEGLPFLADEPNFQLTNTVLPLTSRRNIRTHHPRLWPLPLELNVDQNHFPATHSPCDPRRGS